MLPYPVAPEIAERKEQLSEDFTTAEPVRHIVIDDFLDAKYAHTLLDDLPSPAAMPKSRDYMFSDKRALSTFDRHSDISRLLHDVFMSKEFADFLNLLTGREVFVDPEYVGGGFHAGAKNSFWDLHTDFNLHPAHSDWLRELNILLYLNPGWQPAWGGQLLLTDSPMRPPCRWNRSSTDWLSWSRPTRRSMATSASPSRMVWLAGQSPHTPTREFRKERWPAGRPPGYRKAQGWSNACSPRTGTGSS